MKTSQLAARPLREHSVRKTIPKYSRSCLRQGEVHRGAAANPSRVEIAAHGQVLPLQVGGGELMQSVLVVRHELWASPCAPTRTPSKQRAPTASYLVDLQGAGDFRRSQPLSDIPLEVVIGRRTSMSSGGGKSGIAVEYRIT